MFCPVCDVENDDDAKFCRSCGSSLDGVTTPLTLDATVRSSSVIAPKQNESDGLEDCLYHMLTDEGLKLLDQPSRLRALVADLCDSESRERVVFAQNCNHEFLDPFALVAKGLPDEDELNDATNRAYLVLRYRSIEEKSACDVCSCVRNAVARCMGLREVAAHEFGQLLTEYVEDEDPTPLPGESSFGEDTHLSELPVTQPYEPLPPEVPPLEPFDEDVPPAKPLHPALIALLVALIVAIAVMAYFLVAGGAQDEGSGGGESAEQAASTEQVTGGEKAETPETPESLEIPATVQITLVGGKDAAGTMEGAEVEKGGTYTLPKCAFTREGYVFECWVGNNGVEYTPGDIVAANNDLTFRAQWAAEAESKPEPEAKTDASPEKETSRANPAAAASFPRLWSGVYEGWVSRTESIDRQVSFDFTSVSDQGDLVGVCYVGVAQVSAGATYASYNVRGTIDWTTGDLYVYGTSWIEQGGLADLRQYRGSVDFANSYVAGRASDVDTGDYDGYWRMSAVSQLTVNRPAPVSSSTSDSKPAPTPEPTPEPRTQSRADSFPRTWRGSYEGWTSHISGDDTISRAITFDFTSVSDDGTLEGVCYVGVDEDVAGATNASYYIRGNVDWDTGDIYLAGTSWINQGGLDDLRQYEGTVNFGADTMRGTASDVGTHDYEGDFFMEV